jgi:type I site-specific restriction endonuclease
MSPDGGENEQRTRKRRIDPRLDARGWRIIPTGAVSLAPFRTEEEETANGPADYALWLDSKVVGIVEAKKLAVGPQNVLIQAERYARGLKNSAYEFEGFKAPFLYQHLVYKYDYRQAVRDGYLVDYDVVTIRSNVRMNGVFLKKRASRSRRSTPPHRRLVEGYGSESRRDRGLP